MFSITMNHKAMNFNHKHFSSDRLVKLIAPIQNEDIHMTASHSFEKTLKALASAGKKSQC